MCTPPHGWTIIYLCNPQLSHSKQNFARRFSSCDDPEVHAEVRRGCGCLLNVLEQQVHLTSECKVTDRSPLVAEVSRSHLA